MEPDFEDLPAFADLAIVSIIVSGTKDEIESALCDELAIIAKHVRDNSENSIPMETIANAVLLTIKADNNVISSLRALWEARSKHRIGKHVGTDCSVRGKAEGDVGRTPDEGGASGVYS